MVLALIGPLFFFSSRRRHTRYWRDWSSDVCSSDLLLPHRWPWPVWPRVRPSDGPASPRPARPATAAAGPVAAAPIRAKPMGSAPAASQIGRAAWRERVEHSAVAGSFTKKKRQQLAK